MGEPTAVDIGGTGDIKCIFKGISPVLREENATLNEISEVGIFIGPEGGIGIKNVKEVLKMMYQQDHLLYVENLEPEGTKITIWIPKTLKCTDEEKDEER